jgi:hypothetical protein
MGNDQIFLEINNLCYWPIVHVAKGLGLIWISMNCSNVGAINPHPISVSIALSLRLHHQHFPFCRFILHHSHVGAINPHPKPKDVPSTSSITVQLTDVSIKKNLSRSNAYVNQFYHGSVS